jgi:hypothetical protein
MNQALTRYFRLQERDTTIAQEIRGATATFLTMSYILLVNPQVLSKIGIPPQDAGITLFVVHTISMAYFAFSHCHSSVEWSGFISGWFVWVSQLFQWSFYSIIVNL